LAQPDIQLTTSEGHYSISQNRRCGLAALSAKIDFYSLCSAAVRASKYLSECYDWFIEVFHNEMKERFSISARSY
jgi:hypothetical protein